MTTVTRSIGFARGLGARITFFHAAPDLAATGNGALLYSLNGAAFAEAGTGPGDSVLLKAATAARMAGVDCATDSTVSDRPAQSILETAHRHGCDLVFVSNDRGQRCRCRRQSGARHRGRGTPLNRGRAGRAAAAGAQITRQGRGSGHGSDAADGRLPAPFPHRAAPPKEEAIVFSRLRAHTQAFDETLLELERQHINEAQLLIDSLASALDVRSGRRRCRRGRQRRGATAGLCGVGAHGAGGIDGLSGGTPSPRCRRLGHHRTGVFRPPGSAAQRFGRSANEPTLPRPCARTRDTRRRLAAGAHPAQGRRQAQRRALDGAPVIRVSTMRPMRRGKALRPLSPGTSCSLST